MSSLGPPPIRGPNSLTSCRLPASLRCTGQVWAPHRPGFGPPRPNFDQLCPGLYTYMANNRINRGRTSGYRSGPHENCFVEATAPPTPDGDHTRRSQHLENTNPFSGSAYASRKVPSASEVAETDPCPVLALAESRHSPVGPAQPWPLPPPPKHRSSPPALAHRTSQARAALQGKKQKITDRFGSTFPRGSMGQHCLTLQIVRRVPCALLRRLGGGIDRQRLAHWPADHGMGVTISRSGVRDKFWEPSEHVLDTAKVNLTKKKQARIERGCARARALRAVGDRWLLRHSATLSLSGSKRFLRRR